MMSTISEKLMFSRGRDSTISSVAREAGVSIATVSRVINNPDLVALPTRQRVLRVIQDQNFRISREAQLTRRRHRPLRTAHIGFLAPDLPHRSTEWITEEMCKGIQKVFIPKGIDLLIHYYPYDGDPLLAMPKMLRENSVDGILVRPPANRATLAEFCRNRNAVILGNTFADLDVPCVIVDDWAGMRMIMEYLYELGHRRIGFVGSTLTSVLNLRRLHSYRAFIEEKSLPHHEKYVKIHNAWSISPEEMQAVGRTYLEEVLALPQPPTAIAASTDGIAASLLMMAKELSVRVPEQLSITGFGDQYYAPFTSPPLTTVHIDQRATGEIGAMQLLQMIEGATYSAQTLIRPTFVERRSCAALK